MFTAINKSILDLRQGRSRIGQNCFRAFKATDALITTISGNLDFVVENVPHSVIASDTILKEFFCKDMYSWDVDTLEDKIMFPEETIQYTFDKKRTNINMCS